MSQLNVGTLKTSLAARLPIFTSANKPSNIQPGTIIFNSTTNNVEIWNGAAWISFGAAVVTASGGTVTTSGGYTYHAFTGSGTFTVSGGGVVEFLLVGGGGGGGANHAGGGGAGGLIYNSAYLMSSDTYTITIGSGGPTAPSSTGEGASNGGDTTIQNSVGTVLFRAYGGGGGGNRNDVAEIAPGKSGASGGGGGGAQTTFPNNYLAGAGIEGQGFRGGWSIDIYGGGGGGAGGPGFDATEWGASIQTNVTFQEARGNGGSGLEIPAFSAWGTNFDNTATGTRGWFAGGGGGGYNRNVSIAGYLGGQGGRGGGGQGGIPAGDPGTTGLANTGGGGGGGGAGGQIGSAGGSGIAIFRYVS